MQTCIWLETAKVVLKNTYTRVLNKHHHGVQKQHKRVSTSNVFLEMHCFNSYSELEEPEFLSPPAAFFDVKKM